MNFGLLIKEARQAAGMTQEQLGISCGWTTGNPQSRIGNYEKNVRKPSAADLATIAKATQKNILFFYGEDTPAQAVNETAAQYTTEDSIDLKKVIENDSSTVELRKTIERIEEFQILQKIELTPEQKARVIIACLHTSFKTGTTTNNSSIGTAIKAVF